jgi:hypothetical protein
MAMSPRRAAHFQRQKIYDRFCSGGFSEAEDIGSLPHNQRAAHHKRALARAAQETRVAVQLRMEPEEELEAGAAATASGSEDYRGRDTGGAGPEGATGGGLYAPAGVTGSTGAAAQEGLNINLAAVHDTSHSMHAPQAAEATQALALARRKLAFAPEPVSAVEPRAGRNHVLNQNQRIC